MCVCVGTHPPVVFVACSTISFLQKDVKALDGELDKLKAEKSDLQDQLLGIRL